MPTKAELTAVRALHRRRERMRQGLFLVQGGKLVAELLGSGLRPKALYATEDAARRMGLTDAVLLPTHEMDRMGTLESGNEVVAVVPMPPSPPVHAPSEGELVLVLDGISDPGNLGTILRVADWFGSSRVLCAPGSVDAFNPKCVQASMGAIFRVGVLVDDLASRLEAWRSSGTWLYVASMEGRPVFDVELQRPAALVLGSESHGVSAAVRMLEGTLVSVPRLGGAESLNVAMAASALCMEFTRRTG